MDLLELKGLAGHDLVAEWADWTNVALFATGASICALFAFVATLAVFVAVVAAHNRRRRVLLPTVAPIKLQSLSFDDSGDSDDFDSDTPLDAV